MVYNNLYESIDEFFIDVKKEIAIPVYNGEKVEEVLAKVSDKVWGIYQKNKGGVFQAPGTIHLRGKKAYDTYNEGSWLIDGKTVVMDLDGKNSDLKDYLPQRLKNFVEMINEFYLAETLASLGYKVRYGSNEEDMFNKTDLYIYIDGTEYAVSVFKDSMNAWEKAYDKVKKASVKHSNRVSFTYNNRELSAQDSECVKGWVEAVAQGKYKFGGFN